MRNTSKLILTGILAIGLMAPAYSAQSTDSTFIQQAHPKTMVYQSYVNTKDCVRTNLKVWAAVGGIGGGKPDQRCPAGHPVLHEYDQTMVYTTAVPWVGAVMGAGGNTSAECCAMGYHWVEAS